MANLKEIKTNKGKFSFEALCMELMHENYFEPVIKTDDTDKLLKVLVLFGACGKTELINSIKPEDFVWLGKPEQVFYGFENTKKVLTEGGVLILDNANWNCQVVEQYIKLFQDEETNPHNAQLLIVTNTLGRMEMYMRADQIFLLDLTNSFPGEDELFSICDFKGWEQIYDFDAWYNAGRFGKGIINDYMKNKVGL